jgi:hypothetical protein
LRNFYGFWFFQKFVHLVEGLNSVEEQNIACFRIDEFEKDQISDIFINAEVVKQNSHFCKTDQLFLANFLPFSLKFFLLLQNFGNFSINGLIIDQMVILVSKVNPSEVTRNSVEADASTTLIVQRT